MKTKTKLFTLKSFKEFKFEKAFQCIKLKVQKAFNLKTASDSFPAFSFINLDFYLFSPHFPFHIFTPKHRKMSLTKWKTDFCSGACIVWLILLIILSVVRSS